MSMPFRLFSLFFLLLPGFFGIDPIDKAVLDNFYSSLSDKGNLPEPPDDWCNSSFTVQCNSEGKVTLLEIKAPFEFAGNLPSHLGLLKSLTHLELVANLTGTIPSVLGTLSKLKTLSLSRGLMGTFPLALTNLNGLINLNLGNNFLEGTIPTNFVALLSLENLDLSQNSFGGFLPDINVMANISHADLSNNHFRGTLPSSILNNPRLFSLDLSTNKLVGGISYQYGYSKSLKELFVQDNYLSGTIPSGLASLKLTYMYIMGSNQICSGDYSSFANFTDDPGERNCTPCNSYTCWNGGTCNELSGNSDPCICPSFTVGQNCDACISSYLLNEVTDECEPKLFCEDPEGIWPTASENETVSISCPEFYAIFNGSFPLLDAKSSRQCLRDSNNGSLSYGPVSPVCEKTCALIPCQNGGACFDNKICICPNTKGRFCEEQAVPTCDDIVCLNGGDCIDNSVFALPATCDCTGTGTTGSRCQIDLDDCASSPCQGGSTCYNVGPNQYVCECPSGLTGTQCQIDINDCTQDSCLNGGRCTDSGRNNFSCDCSATGFEGPFCQIAKEGDCRVPSNACLRGICSLNQLLDLATCDCRETGYEGSFCQISKEGDCRVPSNQCINGLCSTIPSSDLASCDCTGTGFGGARCQLDLLDCTIYPCFHGGSCIQETRRCDCSETLFKGPLCEEESIRCFLDSCSAIGECQDAGDNEISCICPSFSVGATCNINIIPIFGLTLAFLFVGLVVGFLQFLLPFVRRELRTPPTPINNTVLFSIFFGVYDIVSDFLFVFQQSSEGGVFFQTSLIFVILPIFFNLVTLTLIFTRLFRINPAMRGWLEGNSISFVAAVLLASTHPESLLLISSGIAGLRFFRAPLPQETLLVLKISGVIGIFLEDVPQLIIQSLVASSSPLSTVTLLSLIASVITIFFGLGVKAALFLVYHFSRKEAKKRQSMEVNLSPLDLGRHKNAEYLKSLLELVVDRKENLSKEETSLVREMAVRRGLAKEKADEDF